MRRTKKYDAEQGRFKVHDEKRKNTTQNGKKHPSLRNAKNIIIRISVGC
jgi:hypothetical protein